MLPLTSQGFEPILKSFDNLNGRRLLDVCSGPGHLAGAAVVQGAIVDAVDISEEMIEAAKARFSQVRFLTGDAEALPHDDDAAFDAVACCFGLLHLPDPALAVREAYRVLRPGGRCSVTLWCGPEQGSDLFREILNVVSKLADMDVDLPPAPPMFQLAEPMAIESVMQDAGFSSIERSWIASAWRASRAEDIADMLTCGTVRTSMLLDRQKSEVRARILEETVNAFRRHETGSGLNVACPSILATGVKPS